MKNDCPDYYKIKVRVSMGEVSMIATLECADLIEGLLRKNELGEPFGVNAYLYGNIIKYLFRLNKKDIPYQDLQKAQNYLAELVDRV